MKIILSPAKTLNLDNPVQKDWVINDKTKTIVKLLTNILNDKDVDINDSKISGKSTIKDTSGREKLKKLLKISDKLVDENIDYINGFSKNITYIALEMYNGMAYKTLDVNSLSAVQRNYLYENLLILSALYGVLKSDEHIKPYRLDFNLSFKVNGQSLKRFWKPFYNSYIKKGETIINLASNEFADLFDKLEYEWYDFDFFEIGSDENEKLLKKKHSTISKKGRGRLLREMAIANVQNVDDIRCLPSYGKYFEIIKQVGRHL